MSNNDDNKVTHFGYQQVPWQEKQQRVAGVFRSVAAKYDVMNDLISMGSHRAHAGQLQGLSLIHI